MQVIHNEEQCEHEDIEHHCWVCDAIASPIYRNGEIVGSHCGCDDFGPGDGPGHAWER